MRKSILTQQNIIGRNQQILARYFNFSVNSPHILDIITTYLLQEQNSSSNLQSAPYVVLISKRYLTEETYEKIIHIKRQRIIIQVYSDAFTDETCKRILTKLHDLKYQIIVRLANNTDIEDFKTIQADYYKFDIQTIDERIKELKYIKENHKKTIAFNINNIQDNLKAEELHFDYYEGDGVHQPTEVEHAISGFSMLNMIDMRNLIDNTNNPSVEQLVEIIKRDPLFYAQVILAIDADRNIKDIEQRIKSAEYNKIMDIVNACMNSNTSNFIKDSAIELAYYRALFCSAVVKKVKSKNMTTNEAYNIGLFSVLDTVLAEPTAPIIINMKLGDTVQNALIYRNGAGGILLNICIAYELNDNDLAQFLGSNLNLNHKDIYNIYYKSVDKASELFSRLRLQMREIDEL